MLGAEGWGWLVIERVVECPQKDQPQRPLTPAPLRAPLCSSLIWEMPPSSSGSRPPSLSPSGHHLGRALNGLLVSSLSLTSRIFHGKLSLVHLPPREALGVRAVQRCRHPLPPHASAGSRSAHPCSLHVSEQTRIPGHCARPRSGVTSRHPLLPL